MGGVKKALFLDFSSDASRRCEKIPPHEAYEYLEKGHYLGRIPSVSHAFGLFRGSSLDGVICYGVPPSPPLRVGICGEKWASCVLEMNRLFLVENKKNDASWLIAKSISLLPRPSIIVSFADPSAGHCGTVYKAANFLYCGLSEKRTDWHIDGDTRHGISVADEFRGKPNRAQLMRKKYGAAFSLIPRQQKHRFLYFSGSRAEVKKMRSALLWKPQ